jgi:hypothetical protein
LKHKQGNRPNKPARHPHLSTSNTVRDVIVLVLMNGSQRDRLVVARFPHIALLAIHCVKVRGGAAGQDASELWRVGGL